MKKFYLILLGVATLSFATLSCTKEAADPSQQEQSQKEENPKEDTTPENPTGEDDTPVPEGMVRLTFGVSHEGDAPANEGDDTKTTWDGTTHGWATGDQIRIIVGEGDVEGTDYVDATVVGGKVTAVVPEADYYYAVYPTSATYALDLANGKLTITVPCYQTGSFSDANIMAAKTTKAAANLEFKNMTSIIKFTTGSTYSYNSVSFMANDQTILTGTVSTTFPSNKFAVDTAVGTESIVCIQKGEPSENAGVSADNTYYLAMLPGAKIDDGIGFKIEECGTETKLIAGGLSKSDFYRERDKIYDMGTLDDRIVTDWYISEFGTGKGNDGANPAGPARLMDLLNPSYSTNNTTAGWRLTNATIHVAGGTYNLQKLNGGEVFDPHYELSDSDLKVHVKGEGDASNPTKFICNQSADNDHIFAVTGSHRVGDFTFENITFTANPEATSTVSSGIAFNYTSTDEGKNTITFKNCTFTSLISTDNTDNNNVYGGAAVFVSTNKKNTLLFQNCSFLSCSAIRGGAVALSNTNAESIANFKDCVFKNNVAATNSGIGGCIYLYAKGHSNFDHSSFIGSDDGNTKNAQHGGAIGIIAGASCVVENGSSFSKFKVGQKGGVIFNHGSFEGNNVSFTSCKSQEESYDKSAGVLFNDGSVNIVNAVFKDNMSNTGSVINTTGTDKKRGVTTIFNSLFEGNEATATDGSGSSQKGCTVYALQYCDVLLVNSTFRGNIEHNASHGVVSPRNNTAFVYLVSCTLSENLISIGESTSFGKDIARTTALITVHNTISTNTPADILNVNRDYSIFTLRRFGKDKNTYFDMDAFSLGNFNETKGVYPLNSSYNAEYGLGMSADDLKKLTFTNISLSPEQTKLLAEDQKGNERTGNIMGAYVLTE